MTRLDAALTPNADRSGWRPSLALRLRQLSPLAGTVVSVPDPALAELLGERLDFLWIDLEHGQLGPREVPVLAIAARAAGCAALVRLPQADSDLLPALLDAGVDGVVAPRVDDAATAQRLAARLRYPPSGTRGTAPRRANSYGRASAPPDADLACIVQIETATGVRNAPEIAHVDGVDALVVGCSDLTLDLGVPGEPNSPALFDAVRRVQDAAGDAGIASGVAGAADASTLASLLAGGSTVVVYSSDVRIYARAVEDAVATLDQVFPRERSEATWRPI
jgi:4-hydroxy-2-oxoheptanedioate aldolase